MPQSVPATFLNIDVELKSALDMAPLAKHLEKSMYVLQCEPFEDGHSLRMEPLIERRLNADAKACTEHMLSALERLPAQLQTLLRSCATRVFDYGFDGGLEDNPLSIDLSPTQLERIAALGATVRMTVYPYRSAVADENEQAQSGSE
jgi:hypothetical protein